MPRTTDDATGRSGFFETYGTIFAFGFLTFVPAVLLLGTQPSDSFNLVYSALLLLPLLLTPVAFVASEEVPDARTFHWKVALLTVVAVLSSLAAVIVGTPVVIYLFINQVGHDRTLTAAITGAGLALVAAPMLPAMSGALKGGRWVRVIALALALVGMALFAWVTVSQSGLIADNLRDDQATVLMGVLGWCIPAFAATAGITRRMGLF